MKRLATAPLRLTRRTKDSTRCELARLLVATYHQVATLPQPVQRQGRDLPHPTAAPALLSADETGYLEEVRMASMHGPHAPAPARYER